MGGSLFGLRNLRQASCLASVGLPYTPPRYLRKCASMLERSVRFVVANSSGQRAATWKCWTSPNFPDVYVACREVGSAVKASLHRSGDWRLAYIEGFYSRAFSAPRQAEHSRLIQRWPRPSELAPGVTLALQIYTPLAAVASPIERFGKRIVHIPAPQPAASIETSLFILTGDAVSCRCPGATSMGTRLVGSMRLVNGDKVAVVYRECAFPEVLRGPVKGHFLEGVDRKSIKSEYLRMLVFGDKLDGTRCLFEMIVRPSDGRGLTDRLVR